MIIGINVDEATENLLKTVADRSPEASLQEWLMSLVRREVYRVAEFDKVVQEQLTDALLSNQIKVPGRPKMQVKETIQAMKNSGKTQLEISKELNVSLSTVTRNWRE